MSFVENLKRSKKVVLPTLAITFLYAYFQSNVFLKKYIFGSDGNGGDMLKIYTHLTDQEIAHLRYQKRLSWHSGSLQKDQFKTTLGGVPDEELKDLGINFPESKSVEYNKRPPHDYYC